MFFFADNMSIIDEKLTKMAHDVKRTKAKKQTYFAPPLSQAADGTETSSLVINLERDAPVADLVTRKRYYRGDRAPNSPANVAQDHAFLMPSYFSEDGYIECFPLHVSLADAKRIEDLDTTARGEECFNGEGARDGCGSGLQREHFDDCFEESIIGEKGCQGQSLEAGSASGGF